MLEKTKIEINAIQDTDLEKALKKSSQYQDLIEGKLNCKSCGTIITEKNIGVIQPINIKGNLEITFYCERIDCVEDFKRSTNE